MFVADAGREPSCHAGAPGDATKDCRCAGTHRMCRGTQTDRAGWVRKQCPGNRCLGVRPDAVSDLVSMPRSAFPAMRIAYYPLCERHICDSLFRQVNVSDKRIALRLLCTPEPWWPVQGRRNGRNEKCAKIMKQPCPIETVLCIMATRQETRTEVLENSRRGSGAES
jgi:hypothetical protein